MKLIAVCLCFQSLAMFSQESCYTNERYLIDILFFADTTADYHHWAAYLAGNYQIANDTLYLHCHEGYFIDFGETIDPLEERAVRDGVQEGEYAKGLTYKIPIFLHKRFIRIRPPGFDRHIKLKKCKVKKYKQGYKSRSLW